MSYGGNGPLIEYATIREYMPKNVKNILWLYYEENDLDELSYESRNVILKKYISDKNFTQNLRNKQILIDQILNKKLMISENKKTINMKSILKNFIKLTKTRSKLTEFLPKKFHANKSKPYKEFENLLKQVKNYAIENKSNFYFVYLPEFNRYIKNYKNIDYLRIKEIVTSLNLNFIDLHNDLIANENDPLNFFPFKEYGHYNIYGYKKIANFIYQKSN